MQPIILAAHGRITTRHVRVMMGRKIQLTPTGEGSQSWL